MSVDQMRNSIKLVYKAEKWYNKVDKMTDGQVVAVYYNFLKSNKLK